MGRAAWSQVVGRLAAAKAHSVNSSPHTDCLFCYLNLQMFNGTGTGEQRIDRCYKNGTQGFSESKLVPLK
jgi:hypothetical protein